MSDRQTPGRRRKLQPEVALGVPTSWPYPFLPAFSPLEKKEVLRYW
jgi:hypothetical protein